MHYKMTTVKRFIRYIINFFSPAKIVKRRKNKVISSSDNFGCLYHLGNLLDQMDDYFKSISHLKKEDPSAYAIYRRIGGQVIEEESFVSIQSDLETNWLNIRPAFGMIHLGVPAKHSIENVSVKFVYYEKHDKDIHTENFSGEIYSVKLFYLWPKKRNMHTGLVKYKIGIEQDGSIKLLKEHYLEKIMIPHRRGKETTTYYRTMFGYSDSLQGMYEDIKDRPEYKGQKITDVAATYFCMVANAMTASYGGMQIMATKKQNSCVFNIDMLRTPYFFKDREAVVDVNGKTKKIFHIVKGHKRKLNLNKEIFIKTHFRGLRKFAWKGYDIVIKDPKIKDTINYTGGSTNDTELLEFDKYMSPTQLGTELRKMAVN